MEQQMEKFWQKMKEEIATQTRVITESVTKNRSEKISEKLRLKKIKALRLKLNKLFFFSCRIYKKKSSQ